MLNSSQSKNRTSAHGRRRRRRRGAARTAPRGRGSRARGSAPPASRSSRAATATSMRPWYESESRGGRQLRLWTDGPPPGPGAGNLAQEELRPRPAASPRSPRPGPRLQRAPPAAARDLERLSAPESAGLPARPSGGGGGWAPRPAAGRRVREELAATFRAAGRLSRTLPAVRPEPVAPTEQNAPSGDRLLARNATVRPTSGD